jgi:SAM-dependent methyltransferase
MPTEKEIWMTDISTRTLQDYDQNAEWFWNGTKDHDVTQNYEAFLSALNAGFPKDTAKKVLDLGCGPGRDLKFFKAKGYHAIGLDGSQKFCEMATAFSACPVLHQDFLKLQLASEEFHGVFANASLFHVPNQELPRVLKEINVSLKPEGILFTSNPRGAWEGWRGERYANYLEFEPYEAHLRASGFEVLHHYYRPAGRPFAEQPWLAVVSRRGD